MSWSRPRKSHFGSSEQTTVAGRTHPATSGCVYILPRLITTVNPWTLGPLNSWTQGDRPFPFLRRSAERDTLQRAMCVALMGHYHCGCASPQALLQLTASPRSASSRFTASLQHTSTEHPTSSSMGFLALRRCGRGGLRLRRTQSYGRSSAVSTGQAHRPPPGAGRQEIGEQL